VQNLGLSSDLDTPSLLLPTLMTVTGAGQRRKWPIVKNIGRCACAYTYANAYVLYMSVLVLDLTKTNKLVD
jgi:hypothetical protein